MWIIFPILAAVAHALSTFLQNYLVDKALPKRHASAYLVMQMSSSILAMVILYVILGNRVLMVPTEIALGLMLAGMVGVLGVAMYMKALRSGDAVEVVVFEAMAPVIALGLGVAFLNETITAMQGLAFILILAAVFILVYSTKSKRTKKLNLATVGWAFGAVSIWVVSDVMFVYFAGDELGGFESFGQGFFFVCLGSLVASLLVIACKPSWRKVIRKTFFGKKKAKNLTAAMLDNGFDIVGEFLFKMGLIAAPAIALTSVVYQVTQLAVVFVLGLLLAKLLPWMNTGKKYDRKLLTQHLVAVILVATGIILLS